MLKLDDLLGELLTRGIYLHEQLEEPQKRRVA